MEKHSKSEPLYTLDEIIKFLAGDDYKLTKRTFQFYVQTGLLPKGVRKGQDTGGVKFYYPSGVVETIKWIFALKSKGYNLTEIKDTLLMYREEELPPALKQSETAVEATEHALRSRGERSAVLSHEGDRAFLNEVIAATPEGETLTTCLQCGTCGGSCPSAADMDYTPRHLFAMLQAGLRHEVLSSNTPWFCVSCYYCTVRCPQRIPITDLMYTLKQMAAREGIVKITDAYDFSKTFVSLVERYGRSFDFGLAMRYRLTHNAADRPSWGSLALKLYKKERIVLGPSRIAGIDQLGSILEAAKRLEAAS